MSIKDYKEQLDTQIEKINEIKRMVQALNQECNEDLICNIQNTLSDLQDML